MLVINETDEVAAFRISEGSEPSGPPAEIAPADGEGREDAALFDLAARIVTGFLVPACQYRPGLGEFFDCHELWKPVRAAAAVIAGASFFRDPGSVVLFAQTLTNRCLRALADKPPRATAEEVRYHAMIAGDKGLSARVAECLVALGVGR